MMDNRDYKTWVVGHSQLSRIPRAAAFPDGPRFLRRNESPFDNSMSSSSPFAEILKRDDFSSLRPFLFLFSASFNHPLVS